MSGQGDDDGADAVTSSASKPTGKERLPVILEPPRLVPNEDPFSAPLFGGPQPHPDGSAEERIVEVQPSSRTLENVETETGIIDDDRMADEGPVGEEEWLWRYDEHGNKIWYRRTESADVHRDLPEGEAGTVRFATRPLPTVGPSTPKPHGYWMVDDRGSYLWYRFVEAGQYVRDPSVERIDGETVSPDERPRPREKLSWTGVGRYDLSRRYAFYSYVNSPEGASRATKADYFRCIVAVSLTHYC